MARTILVLDGERVVRTVLKSILEAAGNSVFVTGDVNVAVTRCENEKPDLIITNVYLPGLTGHEAMNLLKERCSDIPVLMVSGLPDSDVIETWVTQDGFDVFPKPFQAQDLLSKVEQMLTGASEHRKPASANGVEKARGARRSATS